MTWDPRLAVPHVGIRARFVTRTKTKIGVHSGVPGETRGCNGERTTRLSHESGSRLCGQMKYTFVVLLALQGCGVAPGNVDSGPGNGFDAGLPGDSGVPDAGNPDAGSLEVGTPIVTSATVVVHGTHEITWQLPMSGCTTLTLNMKVGTGMYSAVKTLTGVATSTQHSPGHANGTYFYQVVCTRNGMSA